MQTARVPSIAGVQRRVALAPCFQQSDIEVPSANGCLVRAGSTPDLSLPPPRPRPSLADVPGVCAAASASTSSPNPGMKALPAPIARAASVTAPALPVGRRRPSIELLRSLPLLATLEDELAGPLAEQATVETYRRGGLVIEQGQPTLALFGVLDGTARATRLGENGRSLVVDVMQRGNSFGELGLIDGLPHRATVRAVRPCEILALPSTVFSHCLAQSAALRHALMHALADRLRRANQRITMLALNDVRGCVIQHLLDQAETCGGQRLVPGPLRRQGIADTIGASRERVSRVMLDLVRTGVIEMLPDGRARIAERQQD